MRDYNARCGAARGDAATRNTAVALAGRDAGLEDDARALARALDAAVRRRIESDDTAAGISRLDPRRAADARRIQRHLAALGYDPGPVDGVWGPASVAALAAFRAEAGLGGGGWDLVVQRRLFRIPDTVLTGGRAGGS